MSFATGLRQLLALRQTDVDSELRRGETLENILDKHLLTVEGASDDEILTSVLLLSPDGKHLAAANMTLMDIVKMSFFLVRREDMDAVGEVRNEILDGVRPAIGSID